MSATTIESNWLSPAWQMQASDLVTRFTGAQPFRHLVMDDFFRPEKINALLAQFPSFERGNARNEAGLLGGKSVIENISELGDAYAALDAWLQGKEWLDWISTATGIPELQYDPHYFGGGTHDNRNGQELDPHIDFNRHPVTGAHRRLNVIVYLNEAWQEAWGGALELHSDPRSANNTITRITPSFNRCVVFETTEHSWHAFNRIRLPEGSERTRKSIAIYLYSEHRPTSELAKTHSTVYVDRPFADDWQAGHVVSDSELHELRVQLARRDQHIVRLYQELRELQHAQAQGRTARAIRLARRVWSKLVGRR